MTFRVILGILAMLTAGIADTLTLRSGQVIEGTYLGGDSRRVRMAVGDKVESYEVSTVAGLKFGSSAPAKPSPAPAPAAATTPPAATTQERTAAPPAERARILRPDPVVKPAATSTEARQPVNLPEGTQFTVRMIDDVNSERDTVGQTFRASIDEPISLNGNIVVPRGADAVVKLVDDKQSGKLSGRTELVLDLMSVTVDGKTVELNTEEATTASESRTNQSAKVVGGTAALGAIIGAIAGGGKGAAIGAASGAGVGAAAQVITKGQVVKIPSETRLTFALRLPAKL